MKDEGCCHNLTLSKANHEQTILAKLWIVFRLFRILYLSALQAHSQPNTPVLHVDLTGTSTSDLFSGLDNDKSFLSDPLQFLLVTVRM